MKKMKKLLSFMIAAAMVLSMGLTAFADNETQGTDGTGQPAQETATGALPVDSSISVTDLTAGDVVTYFQVLEWVSGKGWAFKAPFDSLTANDLAEIVGTQKVPGKITQEMAGKIAEKATSGGTTDEPLTGTTWEKKNPAAGLYMVVTAAAESGVVYNPAFIAADYAQPESGNTNTISIEATYSDTSVAKKTSIEVKKTEEDSDSEIADAIDSYVGQEVTFHIETTIPVFLPSYKNPSFEIKDSVTEGVELDADTIAVTLDPAAGDGVTAYTITPDGKKGFTVTFDKDYLKSNTVPVTVKIDYKGKVTNTAEFNVNQDENTVEVTYSNGPNEEKGAMKDETNTYMFSLGAKLLGNEEKKTSELVKVAVDEEGNYVVDVKPLDNDRRVGPLPGATFGLYTDDKATTLYTNDLYPNGATFTTGEDGVITFLGLAQGKYYLKETDAPDGYIMDQDIHTVVITAIYKEVTVDDTVKIGTSDIAVSYKTKVLDTWTVSVDGEDETYTVTNDGPISTSSTINKSSFEVENTKGMELPSTGGIGTTLFYIIGSILVIGAGVVLVAKRRMGEK